MTKFISIKPFNISEWKRICFCLWCFLLLLLETKAQTFQYVYASEKDEGIYNTVQDINGNYYLLGTKGDLQWGNGFGDYAGVAIKINEAGDSLINLIYRYNLQTTSLVAVLIDDSSGLVFLGSTFDSLVNDRQILYLRTDTSLNVIDQRIMGNAGKQEVTLNARWSDDNKILVSGYTLQNPGEVFFYKLSPLGDSLTSAYYAGAISQPLAFDLIPNIHSNGYLGLAFGYTIPQPIPYYSAQIIFLDSTLVVDSVKFVIESGTLLCGNWLMDSTFLIATSGFDNTVWPVDFDFRFVHFNTDFTIISDTLFGSSDTTDSEAINSISSLPDGKFYFGGSSNTQSSLFGTNPAYFYVSKFNHNFSVIWQKFIGYNNEYLNLYKVLATNDGGVLLAGTKYNAATANGQERDIYVIKLDSLGNYVTGTGNSPVAQVHDFIVYPNPAASQLTLQYSPPKTTGRATVYNVLGETVQQLALPPNTTRQQLNIADLPAGLYLIKVEADGKSGVKRFVKHDYR